MIFQLMRCKIFGEFIHVYAWDIFVWVACLNYFYFVNLWKIFHCFLRTIVIKEKINESVLFLTSNVIDLFYFWWINPMSPVFISATFVAEYKMLIRRRPDVGGHSVKYKQNENITVFVKYIHINQFIHTQKVHNYRFIYIPSSGNCIPWILTYIAW